QMVRTLPHPLALLEHCLAARRREAVHDQAERFAGGMRVDCLQPDHCGRTVSHAAPSHHRTSHVARRMRAFYSDTFVLPLPDHHRFPMAKYRLLRERLVDEGILAANDLQVPEAIAWADLRLVHDPAYVDAVAAGTLSADAQRRIG